MKKKKKKNPLLPNIFFFQSVQVKFQGLVWWEGIISFPGYSEDITLSRNNIIFYLLEGSNERKIK